MAAQWGSSPFYPSGEMPEIADGLTVDVELATRAFRDAVLELRSNFSSARVWEHTLSPFRAHSECMATHLTVTHDIPMVEAQFLLVCSHYKILNPTTRVGHIHLRLCPTGGTRIRVEVMDVAVDVDVPWVAPRYTTISGPSLLGYVVAVFLRSPLYSRMVFFHLHTDIKGLIRCDYREHETSDIDLSTLPPCMSRCGLLASRHSWWADLPGSNSAYDSVVHALSVWPTVQDPSRRAEVLDLCNPTAPLTRLRPIKPHQIQLPKLREDVMRQKHMLVAHASTCREALHAVSLSLSDNPWLGPNYVTYSTENPYQMKPQQRVCVLILLRDHFQFINRDLVWSFQHDPAGVSLEFCSLYQKLQEAPGLESTTHARAYVKPLADMCEKLQLVTTLTQKVTSRNLSAEWYPTVRQMEHLTAWNPTRQNIEELIPTAASSDSGSRASTVSQLSRSRFYAPAYRQSPLPYPERVSAVRPSRTSFLDEPYNVHRSQRRRLPRRELYSATQWNDSSREVGQSGVPPSTFQNRRTDLSNQPTSRPVPSSMEPRPTNAWDTGLSVPRADPWARAPSEQGQLDWSPQERRVSQEANWNSASATGANAVPLEDQWGRPPSEYRDDAGNRQSEWNPQGGNNRDNRNSQVRPPRREPRNPNRSRQGPSIPLQTFPPLLTQAEIWEALSTAPNHQLLNIGRMVEPVSPEQLLTHAQILNLLLVRSTGVDSNINAIRKEMCIMFRLFQRNGMTNPDAWHYLPQEYEQAFALFQEEARRLNTGLNPNPLSSAGASPPVPSTHPTPPLTGADELMSAPPVGEHPVIDLEGPSVLPTQRGVAEVTAIYDSSQWDNSASSSQVYFSVRETPLSTGVCVRMNRKSLVFCMSNVSFQDIEGEK